MIILHYTGTATTQEALDWLCRPESEVSAHYFIFEDGGVANLVDENRRAWHAGKSCWAGQTDINSRSIGIEIANPGHLVTDSSDDPNASLPEFSSAQIKSVIALCADIISRFAIPPRQVLAHSDIAPGRKRDPGEHFPWQSLAAAGIGHYVVPSPVAPGNVIELGDSGDHVIGLQAMLSLYGYGIALSGQYDEQTQEVVAAFQRHFRPALIDGRADRSTMQTLIDLIEALD